MIKRLVAIGIIFAFTSLAWMILGGATLFRTYNAEKTLRGKVESTWGETHWQNPPRATYPVKEEREESGWRDGKSYTELVEVTVPKPLPLESSDIAVDFALDHRKKGLLWYATYQVTFRGDYRFRNDTGEAKEIHFLMPFPADKAIYDDFRFELEGRAWEETPQPGEDGFLAKVRMKAGEEALLHVGYRSQGMDNWLYRFGSDISRVRDFTLEMTTNFEDIDFPEDTLSPTSKSRKGDGWTLQWRFENLLSGVNIGMTMPNKLQPGPIAGRISLFAPISLFFFIVMVLVVALVRGVSIHPMHFFFLSAAFFAFHLLMAYLADHVSIHAAFIIAAVTSMALVATYLLRAIDPRFTWQYVIPVQAVYLVLFSYTFFFRGYTGLAITIGAVISLFLMMQVTARVDWNEVFARKPGGSGAS